MPPPPLYWAEIRNEKMRKNEEFSNRIYSKTIWSFLVFQHLPMTHFSEKLKKVNFFPIFTQELALNCHKIGKIKSIR